MNPFAQRGVGLINPADSQKEDPRTRRAAEALEEGSLVQLIKGPEFETLLLGRHAEREGRSVRYEHLGMEAGRMGDFDPGPPQGPLKVIGQVPMRQEARQPGFLIKDLVARLPLRPRP